MADNGNDILMRLVLADSALPLLAECRTEVTTDEDPFVWDYYNGQFFEVKEFTFGFNLDDKDPTADPVNTQASAAAAHTTHMGGAARPAETRLTPADLMKARANLRGGGKSEVPSVKFGRWKSATPEQIKTMPPYPVRMGEFSVTRFYDKASPILFEKCCNSDSFASASLVKRKLIGQSMLRGYFRLDFEEVLVTHVSWANAEVMKETFKFVFRKMTAQYRVVAYKPNSNTAELRTLPEVTWSYETELKKKAAKSA